MTSLANFSPISKISKSESCSFAVAHKNSASGKATEIVFLKTLKSKDDP
jgi:hypothetical protein